MQNPETPTSPLLEASPLNMEAIQMGQLVFSISETKVINKIYTSLNRTGLSVGEFLRLIPTALSGLYGVGNKYVEQVPGIQAKLALLGMRHWAAQGHAAAKALLLNENALPEDTQKSMEKLKRYQGVSLANPVSASTVLSINLDSLAKERGWGEVSTDSVRSLSQAIVQQLGGLLDLEEPVLLDALFQEASALNTAAEIDEHLSSAIASFLAGIAEPRDREILQVRLGIGGPQETLEQLGQRMGPNGNEGGSLTRERVRQIEKRQSDLLKKALFVSPSDAISTAKPHPTSRLAHGLPKTRALFHDNDTFLEFFASWSGESIENLHHLEPKAIFETLLPFIRSHTSPFSEDDLIEALREDPDESAQSCRGKIQSLQAAGFMNRVAEHSWRPSNLPPHIGIGHFFLSFQEGLHWKDASEQMKENNLLDDNLSQDHSLHARIQTNPDLFLCGKGEYRHRKYHGLPDAAASSWIRFIKSRIGKEATNLRYWFYFKQKLDAVLNYHELRDVLTRLGEQEGVYFRGKSQAETVALVPNAEPAPNEFVLIDFIENHGKPLDRNEIKEALSFIPSSTVDLKLSELVQAERIMKVDYTHWGPIDNELNRDRS